MLQGAPLFDTAHRRVITFIAEEERLRADRQKLLDALVYATIGSFVVLGLVGLAGLSSWLKRLLQDVTRAYRTSLAAAELRASELRVTLNSIGDAVVATDAQGRVSFLNPCAERLIGWKNQEARGHDLAEIFNIVNEDTLIRVENPVDRVLREHIVVGLANHTILRARDGRDYPIEDSAAPILKDDGTVAGAILVFHDVTEGRDAERALQASERRFRFLDELGQATRLLTEPDRIMAESSRQLGHHLRSSRCAYAEVEADGDRFTILQDYTDNCASTAGTHRLSLFGPVAVANLPSGNPLIVNDVDTELTPAEGGSMFNAIGIKAIICFPLMTDGRLQAMMAVHQVERRNWLPAEISLVREVVDRCWSTIERARAESQLRTEIQRSASLARGVEEAAERFRLLAETVSLQVWTATLDGKLDYANHECVQYFGVKSEQEILGDAWGSFVHPEDLPIAQKTWRHSLETGERYEVEFRLRSLAGPYRWFLVRAQAMRNAGGLPAKWFGTNTDIDEIKRARSAAETANRAKDDFIATLSHELRTPLTPVLISAGALREDERLPSEVREQLAMMERNIALEARLIDDLLDLTSIARGKFQLRTRRSEGHALIDLAVEIVEKDARAKQIAIESNYSARRTEITADPARFQQVIWNLLRNSVKFTPRGGRIAIATRNVLSPDGTEEFLALEVSDSGIGIEPAALEKIFVPFEQASLIGDHRYGGMGLGLAIARAIVELHGGKIAAASAGRDQGATFTVHWPLASGCEMPAAEQSASAPPAPPPAPPPSQRSLRLLLVEDHEATLQVLQRLLMKQGHAVVPAACVADAVKAAAQHTFDLVISDLGLPDGSGVDLMKTLRASYGLRGVALTGYGMDSDLADTRAAGFFAHLIKPVDLAQLRRILENYPA